MCGINGIIGYDTDRLAIESKINLMNDSIYHRGPDDSGIYFENYNNYTIALGMRRLSIIDVKSGIQPMYTDDKEIFIIFNGEIYNFIELRDKLIQQGVIFKTNSENSISFNAPMRLASCTPA